MKIGIYSPYLDCLGGGERYMLTIAEYLSQNHAVDIFLENKKIKEEVFRRLSINLKRVNFVENIFYSKKDLLKKLILTSRYDLIIFLSDGSIPATLAKKNILHFQRPFTNVNGKSALNKLKLSRFQAVICNSKFTKKYIDQEYGIDAEVIYPPVQIEKFSSEKKKNLIISVGRFTKDPVFNKKQIEMVNFFKKISSGLSGWRLVLPGGVLAQDKKYFKQVESKAQGLPIDLFANISFNKLKNYYGQAKIYWHAAGFGENERNNPAAMEHFGISTVEAMASGCVPIAFDGGGQRETVDHGRDGFLWKEEKELIDYTLKLVNDEKLRKKMSDEAIKKSKKFSREKFCQKIEKLLFS